MPLARSLTKKLKRGLSIRASGFFDSEKAIPAKPVRPTISLPLERSDDDAAKDFLQRHASISGWVATSNPPPASPTSSDASVCQSVFSSPTSSRASGDSRTSYYSGDDSYFSPLNIKKVSFIESDIVRRTSNSSLASSVYSAEGELPPPIEEDEEILKKIGKFRFSAAEYIEEIEGTPMILVDGKLYL